MNKFAPIALFTFKRADTLRQTVESLKTNKESAHSDLFIFSDMSKSTADAGKVAEVRKYIRTINGFKSVFIIERETNYGLARSVIEGVTEIINKYGKVIVLEDDLITSPNFLVFMNQGLDFYEETSNIFSIAGYTAPVKLKNEHDDIYFTQRASSWGWATWKEKWRNVQWDVPNYQLFKKDRTAKRSFNKMGSDLCRLLHKQMTGQLDSWAIRWCFYQFLTQQYTVYPTVSKILNIGTCSDATHTKDKAGRFYTHLDDSNKTIFHFTEHADMDSYYLNQFLKPYSITSRVMYKILNFWW